MLGKIALTVGVILFVFVVAGWLARLRSPEAGRGRSPPPAAAEDLKKCPQCGTYSAVGMAPDCDRPGCPRKSRSR